MSVHQRSLAEAAVLEEKRNESQLAMQAGLAGIEKSPIYSQNSPMQCEKSPVDSEKSTIDSEQSPTDSEKSLTDSE